MLELVSGLLNRHLLILVFPDLGLAFFIFLGLRLYLAVLEVLLNGAQGYELIGGTDLHALLGRLLLLLLFQLLKVLVGRLLPFHNKIIIQHFCSAF